MKPLSFSASALTTAEACLSRYRAENIKKARGIDNDAASLGSSVHGALELYVQTAILKQEQEPTLKYLLDLFRMSYMTTFGTADIDTEDYNDGVDMLTRWHQRTDFSNITVLSCEVKESFNVKTSIGEIPFNFIWDRHDQIGETEFKVVDYKTNRWGIRPEDLKKKIQARAYGVAAQIKHPEATRIWVEFDMLRHDGPVGIVYSRDENIAFWRWLKRKAEQIIAVPDDESDENIEKLNEQCNFCIRKQSCSALRKNIAVGGLLSIASAVEAVDLRAQLEWQKKAVENTIKEIDSIILAESKETDKLEFESDVARLFIKVSERRGVDAERVEMVIGPELMRKYGGTSITLASVDKLLKSNELTDAQRKQLKSMIYIKKGEPSVGVEAKNPIDG